VRGTLNVILKRQSDILEVASKVDGLVAETLGETA